MENLFGIDIPTKKRAQRNLLMLLRRNHGSDILQDEMIDFLMDMFLDWDNIEDYSYLVPDAVPTPSVSETPVQKTMTWWNPIPHKVEGTGPSSFDKLQTTLGLMALVAAPAFYKVPMAFITHADALFNDSSDPLNTY